ncbi:DUF3514 domain-containing protein [Ehrlichia ruminantium]|uniref:DUF3514 domain-containing protein n=1 Tax=Ehrlichia ruminantium TaxID=779 RepID=A0AAE6QAB0_EHRRU|nr:DUF3514 domain-containing protein [Ehrlichia ruminantium]QGR02157.1 DUF3514 domain-containing protein [Ehrlichia ruminantium]QGR03078.1 DUF3514 domain-containing protein [Ehrlichia ruminantium]QGR04003.1 DUF3514 domain-containing protein [Ehrlichia ruminantium]
MLPRLIDDSNNKKKIQQLSDNQKKGDKSYKRETKVGSCDATGVTPEEKDMQFRMTEKKTKSGMQARGFHTGSVYRDNAGTSSSEDSISSKEVTASMDSMGLGGLFENVYVQQAAISRRECLKQDVCVEMPEFFRMQSDLSIKNSVSNGTSSKVGSTQIDEKLRYGLNEQTVSNVLYQVDPELSMGVAGLHIDYSDRNNITVAESEKTPHIDMMELKKSIDAIIPTITENMYLKQGARPKTRRRRGAKVPKSNKNTKLVSPSICHENIGMDNALCNSVYMNYRLGRPQMLMAVSDENVNYPFKDAVREFDIFINDPLANLRKMHIMYLCNLVKLLFYALENGCYVIRPDIRENILSFTKRFDLFCNILKLEVLTQIALILGCDKLHKILVFQGSTFLELEIFHMLFDAVADVMYTNSTCLTKCYVLLQNICQYYTNIITQQDYVASPKRLQVYADLILLLGDLIFAKRTKQCNKAIIHSVNLMLVCCSIRLATLYYDVELCYSFEKIDLHMQNMLSFLAFRYSKNFLSQKLVKLLRNFMYMYDVSEKSELVLMCNILFPRKLLSLCADNVEEYIKKCNAYDTMSWLTIFVDAAYYLGRSDVRSIVRIQRDIEIYEQVLTHMHTKLIPYNKSMQQDNKKQSEREYISHGYGR